MVRSVRLGLLLMLLMPWLWRSCADAVQLLFILSEVEAHVQRVNRDADGVLQSYDLTARAQANPVQQGL